MMFVGMGFFGYLAKSRLDPGRLQITQKVPADLQVVAKKHATSAESFILGNLHHR